MELPEEFCPYFSASMHVITFPGVRRHTAGVNLPEPATFPIRARMQRSCYNHDKQGGLAMTLLELSWIMCDSLAR